MEKDLNKLLKEIKPDVEDFFDNLLSTVKSLKLNFMELKTILIEKKVLDSKLQTIGSEYWSNLEDLFGDSTFDDPKKEGDHITKAIKEFDLRFTSIISHIFHKEYFDPLNTFGIYFSDMQEDIYNILNNVQHLLGKNIIPHKDYYKDFNLLYKKRMSLNQSLDVIKEFHFADMKQDEIDDMPSSKLFWEIINFDLHIESKLKRIGKSCIQFNKENFENSENLQDWIKISGVKERKSKRRNPRRKEEYVGLVMKDAIYRALGANNSLSPKELSEEIFTEEALMQEGNKIDKNIAAVLSREKGKKFKSLGNGKWEIDLHGL